MSRSLQDCRVHTAKYIMGEIQAQSLWFTRSPKPIYPGWAADQVHVGGLETDRGSRYCICNANCERRGMIGQGGLCTTRVRETM